MSKQLYEEALADVKSLREVAEDNAKRALIEAVTPRIRDLIERQLLREFSVSNEEEDERDFDLNSSLPDAPPAPGSIPPGAKGAKLMTDNQLNEPPGLSFEMEEPGEVKTVTLDLEKLACDASEPEFDLDDGSLGLLGALQPQIGETEELDKATNLIGKKIHNLSLSKNESNKRLIANRLISQLDNMYAYVQEAVSDPAKRRLYENRLESYFTILNKLQEQKNMRNSRRSLREADVKMTLKGLPDDLNLEDLEIDLESGDDEAGEEEEDMDMEGGDEEGAEDMDLEGDEGGEDEGGDDMDLDLEGGEDEGGEEEEDLELSVYDRRMESRRRHGRGHARGRLFFESDDKDEDDESQGEDDEESPKKADASESRRLRDNVIVEIDEGMLRKEISRMKVLRETRERNARRLTEMKRRTRRIAEKAEKVPSTKGHGPGKLRDHEDLGDPILDIDLNELSEALRRERRGSSRNDVRPNDTSRRVHTENDNKLRAKLAEANLFNAKLAYSNKLLQNESLTKRQKAQVIERLDEAKTLREVKLVYESLVKTMAGTSRPLRESNERRVLGSSSRPTRPASTQLNEGVETERWARLAGIIK